MNKEKRFITKPVKEEVMDRSKHYKEVIIYCRGKEDYIKNANKKMADEFIDKIFKTGNSKHYKVFVIDY